MPLVKDAPFFQLLEVDGAVRYANYSTSGGSTTYTGSGQWKPVNDLLFRGSYATGFRAPSIGESFGAASRSDAPIDDPCTNVHGIAVPDIGDGADELHRQWRAGERQLPGTAGRPGFGHHGRQYQPAAGKIEDVAVRRCL